LTGLYSRRQFKVLYHNQLNRKALGEPYCVAVFTLENLDGIIAGLGHEAGQEAIRTMGVFIDKYFGAMGGFATRLRADEFAAMLPYCDLEETETILKNFIGDFRERGIRDIAAEARKQAISGQCVEFTILGGLAQGQPFTEMDAALGLAESRKREIGRFSCTGEG
jgi:phospholipid/cholesterol/gamma-HCH transport system ATP-binding protein